MIFDKGEFGDLFRGYFGVGKFKEREFVEDFGGVSIFFEGRGVRDVEYVEFGIFFLDVFVESSGEFFFNFIFFEVGEFEEDFVIFGEVFGDINFF